MEWLAHHGDATEWDHFWTNLLLLLHHATVTSLLVWLLCSCIHPSSSTFTNAWERFTYTLAFVFLLVWKLHLNWERQVKWAICLQWTVCQVALRTAVVANYIIRHAVGYYDYGLLVELVASRQLVSSLLTYSLTSLTVSALALFALPTAYCLTDSVSFRIDPCSTALSTCLPAVLYFSSLLHVLFCGNDDGDSATSAAKRHRQTRHHPALCHQGKEFSFAGKVAAGARRCKLVILPCRNNRHHWRLTWKRAVHCATNIDDFPSWRRSTWDAINS